MESFSELSNIVGKRDSAEIRFYNLFVCSFRRFGAADTRHDFGPAFKLRPSGLAFFAEHYDDSVGNSYRYLGLVVDVDFSARIRIVQIFDKLFFGRSNPRLCNTEQNKQRFAGR